MTALSGTVTLIVRASSPSPRPAARRSVPARCQAAQRDLSPTGPSSPRWSRRPARRCRPRNRGASGRP